MELTKHGQEDAGLEDGGGDLGPTGAHKQGEMGVNLPSVLQRCYRVAGVLEGRQLCRSTVG